jgi:hypothetical protein
VDRWVERLPLVEVARRWGLTVEVFDGEEDGRHGFYRRGRGIGLGVRNLATWCHELVHAADDRAGSLTERGQHWRSETVAQLGAAVLLRLLGHDAEADLGGSFRYLFGYALEWRLHVAEACGLVLDRTCQAVRLILDTAGEIAGSTPPAAGEVRRRPDKPSSPRGATLFQENRPCSRRTSGGG